MKKALLAALFVTVLVILTAPASFARGGRGQGGEGHWACFTGPRSGRAFAWKNIEAPQEIRDKWAEAQKIAIDLRNELGRDSIDRNRALELRTKHRAIMQEICDWRFQQILDAEPSERMLSRPGRAGRRSAQQ